MDKQEQLDQIKADIVNNNICPDLATQATNLVFGDGNPNADIVFIGEAPGKQEDEQGLPFVGASGKFLSEMLTGINMRREEIYITNIVKYRPPNNRDPEPAEKQAFLPYLLKQLMVIQPLLVVTLGRHSMTCFIPDAKISQIHGQPKRITIGERGIETGNKRNKPKIATGPVPSAKSLSPGKIVILPLYHPAAALYNGSMRAVLQEDFSTIPEILRLIRKGK
jgi:uracil-DNA glycosylase family 4